MKKINLIIIIFIIMFNLIIYSQDINSFLENNNKYVKNLVYDSDNKFYFVYDLEHFSLSLILQNIMPGLYNFKSFDEIEKNEINIDYSNIKDEDKKYLIEYFKDVDNYYIFTYFLGEEFSFYSKIGNKKLKIRDMDQKVLKIIRSFLASNYNKITKFISNFHLFYNKKYQIEDFFKIFNSSIFNRLKIRSIFCYFLVFADNNIINDYYGMSQFKGIQNKEIGYFVISDYNSDIIEDVYLTFSHEMMHYIFYYFNLSEYIKKEIIDEKLIKNIFDAAIKMNFIKEEYYLNMSKDSLLEIIINYGMKNPYNIEITKKNMELSAILNCFDFSELFAYLLSNSIVTNLYCKKVENIQFNLIYLSRIKDKYNLRLDNLINWYIITYKNLNFDNFFNKIFNFTFDLFIQYINAINN